MKTDSRSDAEIRRDLLLAKYRGEFKARRQNQSLTEDDVAQLRATLAHKAHTEMAAAPWQDDVEIDKRVLATFNSDGAKQDKELADYLTKKATPLLRPMLCAHDQGKAERHGCIHRAEERAR